MHSSAKNFAVIGLAALLAGGPLRAVTTQGAVQNTYEDYQDGQFENVALPADGGMKLAPALERVAKLDASVIWKAVADTDGNLYVGTGNNGKVFKVTPEGKTELVFQPEEVLTRALAVDAKGNLFIGTSPDGRVYRLAPGGRPEIYFDPPDTYIWDLALDKEGRLYVATGAKGRIYRLPVDYRSGQPAEVWFESDRTHITTLAFDGDGRLLAGSGPKALIYRITNRGESVVLANPNTDEVTGLYAAPGGAVYFSTFNRSGAASSLTPPRPPASSPSSAPSASSTDLSDDGPPSVSGTTTITVSPSGAPSISSPSSSSASQRSQLLRISPDGFVEPVWSLNRVGIFCFRALPEGRWLLGSDQQARLFSAANPQDWELLQQAKDSSEISTMLPDPADPTRTLIFSSNPAQIFRLGAKPAAKGTYTCETFDSSQISRWGSLRVLARPPQPGSPLAGAKWETRTGNTPKPDTTWSSWAAVGDDARIASPAARYFQFRVTLDNAAVGVRSLEIFYQHFNAAPVVSRVGVAPVGVEITASPASRPSLSLGQIADGDASASLSPLPVRPQVRLTGDAGSLAVAWRASDPNGDILRYGVQLRTVGEDKWITLANDLENPVYSFSTRGFADGYYEIRVTATDKLDNLPGEAREGERISAPFLIDNSPPEVTLNAQSGDAASYTLNFRAKDSASVLDKAQYTLDGQPPKPALPEGGLFDRTELTFRLRLERLKSGPHSVVFEVTDEAGNTGATKASFETP